MPVNKCDYCGLPPLPNKRLLKCTRCNQAYYHDRTCQQAHYPKHKAECRRIARAAAAAAAKKTGTTNTNTNTNTTESSTTTTTTTARERGTPTTTARTNRRLPLVECRTIEGRGRSLFATTSLKIGCHPLPTANNDGLCEPIAHPVLLESMRNSRCAFCFRLIHDNYYPSASSNNRSATTSFHRHCSSQCQSLDTNWTIETRALRKLPSPPSPTALSCSRILRKFQSSPSSIDDYNQLCYYNVDLLSQKEKDAYKSIMTQCHVFLLAMNDTLTANAAYKLLHPPDNSNPAYQFMSRLCMNGFSISNSEQIAIGHGVYCGTTTTTTTSSSQSHRAGGASAMNHSCRPNAVPTFWLRTSRVPILRITICRDVRKGSEVTISYCDGSSPRHVRREGLWKNYKFVCDCALCEDTERDDDVVGLKCTAAGCKGRVKSISANEKSSLSSSSGEEGTLLNTLRYQCVSCGNTSFENALQSQANSMEKMKALESMMNSNSSNDDRRKFRKNSGVESMQLYELSKRHCNRQKSYYVAWSADLFVHWCANALNSHANDEREQLELCRRALVVTSESRSAMKFCSEYPGNLVWYVKRGVEAKLRLFSNPADMEALGMLRDVRNELLNYYPSDDDTICSLEESLAAYSFS